jgi:hypothetical protein
LPSIERLKTYRLRNDLTFDALADEMRAAGCAVRMRNLHRMLTDRLQTVPRARTLFQVDQFVQYLDALQRQAVQQLRRRRRRTAA